MIRGLFRLLLVGLGLFLALAAFRYLSRMLNREEDFDDYDDLEDGLEFTETPVEIDVPATDSTPAPGMAQTANLVAEESALSTGDLASEVQAGADTSDTAGADTVSAGDTEDGAHSSLIDINGIGPTYASRLQDAGIYSLDDLAGANAEELAGRMDVIGGRTEIENWITQAQGMTRGEQKGSQ